MRRRLGASAAAVLVLAGASSLLTGCGGGEENEIARALHALRAAYADQRYDVVCSHLTRGAQLKVGRIGHFTPTTCEQDMAGHLSAGVLSRRDLAEPEIRSINVDGDHASMEAIMGGSAPMTLDFQRQDGQWKLATLFGTIPSRGPLPRPDGPRPPSVAAAYTDSNGLAKPCPQWRVQAIIVAGGCILTAQGQVVLTVFSAFGDRLYARCLLHFNLHVDKDGGLAFSSVGNHGGDGPAGDTCGDIYTCINNDSEELPWRGQIVRESNGKLEAVVHDMCFDTCLGRFAGQTSFDLFEKPSGRLALSTELGKIGSSGLAASGNWRLQQTGSQLRIRPRTVLGSS